MKKIIAGIALLFSVMTASAHALWIETKAKGAKNKAQEVNVFFGEYGGNERDTVAKWFSNLKAVKLFVTGPGMNKQEISLKDAVNHYAGSFAPAQDGTYTLYISHSVADVYGEMKIEYYATATVVVGKESESALASSTALSVVPAAEEPKATQQVGVKVFNDKQAAAKVKVEIVTPDGWVKTLYSNEQGEVSFKPIAGGQYVLEAVKNDRTPGTHNGKSYKAITHLVTHCIYVK